MKTLLLALLSPEKSLGTREGAIRGLICVGTEAVRKGLVEGGGIKSITAQCATGDSGSAEVSAAILDAIAILSPPSQDPQILDVTVEEDMKLTEQLRETFGDVYAQVFLIDRERAVNVLKGVPA